MDRLMDVVALHEWFERHRRPLPWRESITPYRIWISEVMLQQTRVSVVIPYFERWMKLFPDLETLAAAPLHEVIKAWEGLGYYHRARHIHEGARRIITEFGGQIPHIREQLEQIEGLGPYTIRAILSFAFHQRVAAVDANVSRVITRYFLLEDNPRRGVTKRTIQELADKVLDASKPWVTAEALIELGATLCHAKPLCGLCPLRHGCRACKEERADQLPIKIKRPPPTILTRAVAVVEESGFLLLQKGKPGKVMAGLYEFPHFEGLDHPLARHLSLLWKLRTSFVRTLPLVRHSFTRYQAHLFPVHLKADERVEVKDLEWVSLEQAQQLPFSSGHRRVFSDFLKHIDQQLTLF